MSPALYVQGKVIIGSNHGEAYSRLTPDEKNSEIHSGFFDMQSSKFIADDCHFYVKKILLIRHGETTDGHINDQGRHHCLAAAIAFHDFDFKDYKCYCSPQHRCIETAYILSEQCKFLFSVEPNVVERRQNSETDEDFLKRATFVLDWLPEKSIIISHCDFILAVLRLTTNEKDFPELDNCSSTYIENHHAVWVGKGVPYAEN